MMLFAFCQYLDLAKNLIYNINILTKGMIEINNSYKTVRGFGEAEIVEKRSRFIASVKPVTTEKEAEEYINHLRKEYWDARHNVYAYILRENNIMRYSDDGEPAGTAGVPVLDILKKEELTDLIVVVTRYFGGILLGTGGLVHAYSKSAKEGLAAAGIKTRVLCREILIKCDYTLLGKVQYEVASFSSAVCGDIIYGESVEMSVFVPAEDEEKFIKFIVDKTNAKAETSLKEIKYMDR